MQFNKTLGGYGVSIVDPGNPEFEWILVSSPGQHGGCAFVLVLAECDFGMRCSRFETKTCQKETVLAEILKQANTLASHWSGGGNSDEKEFEICLERSLMDIFL